VNDTSPPVEKQFRRMLLRRSRAERLQMGCSMHATARALVKASISEKDPVALKRAFFLRFYGEEFGLKERKKILLALRKAAERKGERDSVVKYSGSGAARESGVKHGRKTEAKAKGSQRLSG
jgi:hypothetical protein